MTDYTFPNATSMTEFLEHDTLYIMGDSSTEYQNDFIKRTNDRLKLLKQRIKNPLTSTTDWKGWDSSLKVAFWIYGLTKWIKYHASPQNSNLVLLEDVLKRAYDLSMYRTVNEWEVFAFPGGEFSVFLKNRNDL